MDKHAADAGGAAGRGNRTDTDYREAPWRFAVAEEDDGAKDGRRTDAQAPHRARRE